MIKKLEPQRRVLRCSSCESPLGVMEDDRIHITTHNKKGRNTVVIKFKHSHGGFISLECGNCAGLGEPHFIFTLSGGPIPRLVKKKSIDD